MFRRAVITLFIIAAFTVKTQAGFTKDSIEPLSVFHLKDGQTVIIKEVHKNHIVTIDTWVKTGSINENDENNGISHFLEHLMFKGTKTHKAGAADKILESKGATYNAATSNDFTHFFVTLPSTYAATALNLQADMLLNAVMPTNELNKERKVVQEEIRRAEDNPNRTLFKNLNNILFKTHPYKYETLGTVDMIEHIPRQDILNYYHKWYVPSNMTTVVVGDVDTKKILALVKKDFHSDLNFNRRANQISYKPESSLPNLTENIEKGNFNTGYEMFGFRGVSAKNRKDSYALDLAAVILCGGRSSRLYQDLKEKKNLVSTIDAGHMSMRDDSVFYVDANIDPKNSEILKKNVIEEIAKLREEKVSEEELQRAKTQMQRQFLYNTESVEEIANSLGYYMTLEGNIDGYTKYIEEINKITADDILDAAAKYLQEPQMAISILLPENIQQSANSDQNIKPVKDTVYVERYKNVVKSELTNGMTLITEKNDSNNIISLSVFVKGGALFEPIPGMTEIIDKTLLKGTANRTSVEISKELENSGIIISPSSTYDYFEIQLKSTKDDFDKAFDILTDVLKNPLFKDRDVAKAKSDIVQDIHESRDDPSSLVFEKFNKVLFPDHPYGYQGEKIEENLPHITRENILDFYNKNFIPENMIISVSGDIDDKELSQKFNKEFSSSGGDKLNDKYPPSTDFKPLDHNEFICVTKKTNAASLLLGWPVVGLSSDKEYATLKIMSAILGNGMSSRLFVDLREKQGLAYVINSLYPSRLDNSFFVLYIGTEPKNVSNIKKGFLDEIKRIKTVPISAKELEEVKQKLIGQFELSQETNQQRAHNLGWFELMGKGYKSNYHYSNLLNSVTIEDIKKTANKYFNYPYIMAIVAPEESIKNLEKGLKSESKR